MKTDEKTPTTPNPTSQVNVNTGCDLKEDKDLMKTIWIFFLHKVRYS
jgi:hypothetical protein